MKINVDWDLNFKDDTRSSGFFFFFLVNRKYLINNEKHEYESQQISQNATPQAHALEVCKIK
jgi:hypothetical protein